MQRIRIERKAPERRTRDAYAPVTLDPRDQDILRAKALLRRQGLERRRGSITERLA